MAERGNLAHSNITANVRKCFWSFWCHSDQTGQDICHRIVSYMYFFFLIFISMSKLHVTGHNKIYNSLVQPHLDYRCEVWNSIGVHVIASEKLCTKITNRAARIILHADNNTSWLLTFWVGKHLLREEPITNGDFDVQRNNHAPECQLQLC